MSQSDYITYKRTQIEWKLGKLPTVLDPSQYESFKDYALENTVINQKLSYSQLQPVNTQNIYNMVVPQTKYNQCSPFLLCNNTNIRPNRILMHPVATIQPRKYKKIQTVYCCNCISGRNCYCNKKICKSKTMQICKTCHQNVV
jgi:hypothetical protein